MQYMILFFHDPPSYSCPQHLIFFVNAPPHTHQISSFAELSSLMSKSTKQLTKSEAVPSNFLTDFDLWSSFGQMTSFVT